MTTNAVAQPTPSPVTAAEVAPTAGPERHHQTKKSESISDADEERPSRRRHDRDNDEQDLRTDSNRDERQGFVLDATLVGFTVPSSSLAYISGLSAGHYINDRILLSLDFQYAASSDSNDYHETVRTWGVHARYFPSHSFNVKVGLAYRDVASSRYVYSSDPSRSTSKQEVVANIAVGNMWQFRSFVLGCDWFTYNRPLYSTFSSSGNAYSLEGANYEFVKLFLGFNF